MCRTAANAWTRLLEDLSDLNVERNISHIIPSTTLVRMQLRLCAEYLPAYWRVARSTYFNHDTSGIAANYILSRYIGDFYAGQRLTNEIRDHFSRWLRFGQTHFGSMIEIDDEGHWTMPIRGMGLMMKMFDNDQPEWWNAALRTEAVDMYRRQMQYYFRHASQTGFFYRVDHDYPSPDLLFNFTNPARGYYMFNCRNKTIPFVENSQQWDPYVEPEVQNVIWQAYGPGRPRPNASKGGMVTKQRQALWDAASVVLEAAKKNGSTHVPTVPTLRTDVMPYAALFWVRGGWKPEDLLLHCIGGGAGLGDNSYNDCDYESNSCQPWEWGIETLGCQLLLAGFPSAMMRMPLLDGQAPMPYFDTKGFNPGSKTNGLSYAPLEPARGRFFSSSDTPAGQMQFDVVEPLYSGRWAKLEVEYEPVVFDMVPGNLSQSTEKVIWPTQAVSANYSRIIIHAVGFDALFVVERAHGIRDGVVKNLSTGFLLRLAINGTTKATSVSDSRVQLGNNHIFADNSAVDMASLHVHHASPSNIDYTLLKESTDTDEGGIRLFDKPLSFVQVPVAVSWTNEYSNGTRTNSNGITDSGASTPLLSLLHRDRSKLNSSSVRPTLDGLGIDASSLPAVDDHTSSGSREFCLRTSSSKPAVTGGVTCFGVNLKCDTMLASRSATDEDIEGVALGCAPVNGFTSDFTFIKPAGGIGAEIRMKEPILQPMSKPVFSPTLPAFAGHINVSISCGTTGRAGTEVEIRFTLDGTDPTRSSTLFTSPIALNETTGIKARCFCISPACLKLGSRSKWAADGTRFSAIAYGTYVRSDMRPPTATTSAQRTNDPAGTSETNTGLCVRVLNSTGSWAELYSFAGSDQHAGVSMGVQRLPLTSVAPPCVLSIEVPPTYYSTEWSGVFNADVGGVWSFYAPAEFAGPNIPAGYDLRLWIDDEELALLREVGGIDAAWQVAIFAGLHTFRMVLSDARCYDDVGENVAGAVSGLWRDFPSPWCVYNGSASAMRVATPHSVSPQPLDASWFSNTGCGDVMRAEVNQ